MKYKYLTIKCSAIFLILFAWWLATQFNWVSSLFLPSPSAVWHKFIEISQNGFMKASLWQHLAASLERIITALFLAILIGIPLGIFMGINKAFNAFFDPLIEFLRPIPPLAYLPLLVIWLGIGESSKILLIFLSILPPIVINTIHGILSHKLKREHAALSLGATQNQIFFHIIFPTALPHIVTGIRIGLGIGWSTLVAAELIAADRGLGFMIQSASQFLITDTVFLGIILISMIAISFELFLRWLQKKISPWYLHQE